MNEKGVGTEEMNDREPKTASMVYAKHKRGHLVLWAENTATGHISP